VDQNHVALGYEALKYEALKYEALKCEVVIPVLRKYGSLKCGGLK